MIYYTNMYNFEIHNLHEFEPKSNFFFFAFNLGDFENKNGLNKKCINNKYHIVFIMKNRLDQHKNHLELSTNV